MQQQWEGGETNRDPQVHWEKGGSGGMRTGEGGPGVGGGQVAVDHGTDDLSGALPASVLKNFLLG